LLYNLAAVELPHVIDSGAEIVDAQSESVEEFDRQVMLVLDALPRDCAFLMDFER
jgi:hypothetical protein